MITIRRIEDCIIFRGHTIPQVCAAVSSIMYTSMNMLIKYDKESFSFKDNEEFVEIVILKHDDIIDMVINNMFDMLNDVIEEDNEDKIRIICE